MKYLLYKVYKLTTAPLHFSFNIFKKVLKEIKNRDNVLSVVLLFMQVVIAVVVLAYGYPIMNWVQTAGLVTMLSMLLWVHIKMIID